MALLNPFQKRARTQALRQTADALGMEFSEKDDWGLKSLLKDFELFQKGGRRRIINLMSQESGLMEEKVNICDYQFTVSTGKSTVTRYQTVFFIQSKALELPKLLIYPEKFYHKIGAWFGMQDIGFEQWPEFSNKFLVQGDEWGLRHMMSEPLTQFFLKERRWCVEGLGYYFIFYKKSSLIEPSAMPGFYEKGMSLYSHLRKGE